MPKILYNKFNMSKLWFSRILSIFGILAPPVIITITITAGLLTPGYSQITDTISSLSDQASKNPQLMTSGFIVYGVLIIGFSYALYLHLHRGFKAYTTWVMLTLYGICMILAGLFRDSPGALNTEGFVHNAVIITSCLSMLFGMWTFAGSVYKRTSWIGFTWFTIIASFLGLVLSIIFAIQSYVPFAGLLQRIFYCIILIWIEVVSIWLFRLSFQR
jgi:hypothetical membrane protein